MFVQKRKLYIHLKFDIYLTSHIILNNNKYQKKKENNWILLMVKNTYCSPRLTIWH